jgi:hypothetical protein
LKMRPWQWSIAFKVNLTQVWINATITPN